MQVLMMKTVREVLIIHFTLVFVKLIKMFIEFTTNRSEIIFVNDVINNRGKLNKNIKDNNILLLV